MTDDAMDDFLKSKRIDITPSIDGWDAFYRYIASSFGKRLVFLYFRPTLFNLPIFSDLAKLARLEPSEFLILLSEGLVAFMDDHILLGIRTERGEVDARRLDVYIEYE